MALFHSPSIVTSNLVLCLDSANPKSWSQNIHPYPLDIGTWATSGDNATLSRDTSVTDSPAGGVPLKMVATNTSRPDTNTTGSPSWHLAPSTIADTWTASAWVKASANTTGTLRIFGVDDASFAWINGGSTGNIYTYWTRISYTLSFSTASPNITKVQLSLEGPFSGGPAGQTIWWDGLQVERSTSATPFKSNTNTNGNTFYDLSALRNTVTTFNNPSYVAGPVAYTAYNGSTQYLQYSPTTQFGNTDFSIEFVLKVSATSANYGIMLWGSGPFNSAGKGIEVRFQTNGFEYTVNDGVGAGTRLQYSFTNIADGAWRHFTITQVRAGTATLYVNGVSVATQSYSGEVTFTDVLALQIGKGTDGYLNGQIPLFKMYNAALSAADVQKNFSAVRGRFSL